MLIWMVNARLKTVNARGTEHIKLIHLNIFGYILTSFRLGQDPKHCLFYSSLSLDILYGLLTFANGAPSYMT
jgi:hypothetical protein